jgi:hypothetical protein
MHARTHPPTHTHARMRSYLFCDHISCKKRFRLVEGEKPSNPVISHDWKPAGNGVGVQTPCKPLFPFRCVAPGIPRRECLYCICAALTVEPTNLINWTVFLHIFIHRKFYQLALRAVTQRILPIIRFDKETVCDISDFRRGTGSFPGVKRPERGADHPPPSSAEVKKEYSYTSTHPLGHCRPVTG